MLLYLAADACVRNVWL